MVTRRRPSTPTIAGVAITHPDRVIAQAPELTRLDIVRYYDAVAEVMLPHLRDRPGVPHQVELGWNANASEPFPRLQPF
jgi:DNA primase